MSCKRQFTVYSTLQLISRTPSAAAIPTTAYVSLPNNTRLIQSTRRLMPHSNVTANPLCSTGGSQIWIPLLLRSYHHLHLHFPLFSTTSAVIIFYHSREYSMPVMLHILRSVPSLSHLFSPSPLPLSLHPLLLPSKPKPIKTSTPPRYLLLYLSLHV